MTHLGSLALYLAFVLALYAIVTSLWGAFRRRSVWIATGTHAAYAVFGCVLMAVAALLHALVTRDFNLEYVAAYSSSTLPLSYTIAALWGGQKGSLLFWTFILTFFSTIVQVQNRAKNRELMPYVTATLMIIALFFLGLLCFITPPFERLAFTPKEGSDLNPLLQNYWMTIHPPSLYLGYVSAAVPFAFALAVYEMKMTPAEALVAVTINAAAAICRENEIGSIAHGKLADIVILKGPSYLHLGYHAGGNPVDTVIKRGRLVVRDGQRL